MNHVFDVKNKMRYTVGVHSVWMQRTLKSQ